MSAVRDDLAPRAPGGRGPGLALSVLAHAGLLAALAWGVAWRSPPPVAVSAELWSALPQTAAAPAPEPPTPTPTPAPVPTPAPAPKPAPAPPPRAEADIALEKARAEKARQAAQEERERRERLARQKVQEKAEEKAEARARKERLERQEREKAQALARERERQAEAQAQARLEQQRTQNLERMMGQLPGAKGSADSKGSAAVDAGPSRQYAGLLRRAIGEIFYAGSANPSAVVEVRAAPGGTIIGRRLVRASGDREWDEAVLRALDRLASLPKDSDGRVPSTIEIALRPRD